MGAQGSTKTIAILGGAGSPNDKGWFVDLTALQTAYPTGSNGWFAITGTPDAIWIWDSGTSAWVNSGGSGTVTSVFGRAGAVVATAGDYNAGQITNTPSGNISATTVQAAINELDTEKAADSSVVHKTGAVTESIDGIKTFTEKVTQANGTLSAGEISGYDITGDAAGNVGYLRYNFNLLTSSGNVTGFLGASRTPSTAFLGVELDSVSRDGFRIKTGTATATEAMRIAADGKVAIGTTSTPDKVTILGPDNTVPALGASGAKLGLYNVFGGNPGYGMIFGVLSDGKGYIQQQRVDGTATSYDLQLQPNGGTVSINPAGGSTPNAINIGSGGTYIGQVNGNTRIRSAFSGKTFDLQNSASVTKFSVDYDTGNVTAPNIVLKGAYGLIVGATKADYVVDGTADNVEIQAAIDASNAAGGGTVWFSTNILSVTGTITPKSNVTLRSLTGKTEIRAMSNIGYIFYSPETTTLTNFTFKDITFNVNGQTGNSGVQILRFDGLSFEDCIMKNSNAIWGIKVGHKATTDAPSVHKSKNLRITNLHFDGGATATYEGLLYLNTDGVNVDGVTESGFSGAALISSYIYSTDVNLRRVNITPNASMMAIDVTINDRCHIYDSSYINSHATGRTGVMIRNSRAVKVFRNHFELGTATSDYGVLVLDWATSIDGHSLPSWNSGKSEYIEIYKNKLVNTYGIAAHRNGVDTTCTVKDLSIHDNNIDGPNDTGIRVGNVSWAITGNIDNLSIYNNTINGRTSGTNDGISLLGTSSFKFRNLEMYGNNVTAGGGNTDGISIDYAESGFIGQNTLTPSGTGVAYNVTNSPNLKWHAISQMSIVSDKNGVKLDGDSATPGNSKYYGTDSGGVKGYHTLPSGSGSPGGGNTQVQVNNSGSFAGYSKFRYIDAFGEINLGEENGYGGIVGAEATTVDANGSDLGVYGGIGNGYGNGGNLYVSGGAAGIAGSGGDLEVSGGVAGTYEGDGGNITVSGGDVQSSDNYTGQGGDFFMSGGQGKIRGGNAGLIGGNSNAYGGTIYFEGGLGPIAGDISFSPGYSPGEITNGIETFAINAAGTGYAIYDRFTVNTGSVLAEFVVLDVGVSGEVNQIAQATLGSGYSVGTGFLTTNTVGTGTGLTIDILTLVSGGNGKIYFQQPNTGFKVELDISALTADHKVSIQNETGKLALLTDTRHKRRSTKKVPKFTTINTFDTSADYTYWWTGGGAGSTSFPTSGMYEGAGCYQISAVAGAITGGRFAIPGGAKDYRGHAFTFRVKVPTWSTISLLQVFFSTEATGPTNYYPIDLKSKITAPVDNEWMEIQIGPGDFSAAVGTPTWSAISHYWLNAQTSSGTQDVQFDILQNRESINFPTVCFTFDDSLASQFTIAVPELLSRGIPAEFYPIWNEVGTGGATATLDQLKDASKKGFLFGYHGGTAYTDIGSTALLQAEIAEEAKFLASNGLHGCDGGALPNGKFNKAILEELGITYAYNRDVSWLLNYPDYLPEDGLIHAVSPDSATSLATLTGFIDKAIANCANVTFAIHGIAASSPTGAQILTSTLTGLLDHALTKQNEGKLKCKSLNTLTYDTFY